MRQLPGSFGDVVEHATNTLRKHTLTRVRMSVVCRVAGPERHWLSDMTDHPYHLTIHGGSPDERAVVDKDGRVAAHAKLFIRLPNLGQLQQ